MLLITIETFIQVLMVKKDLLQKHHKLKLMKPKKQNLYLILNGLNLLLNVPFLKIL